MSSQSQTSDRDESAAAKTLEWLDSLDARFKAEETEDWQYAYKRTSPVEYAARQARQAVRELRHRIKEFNQACHTEAAK